MKPRVLCTLAGLLLLVLPATAQEKKEYSIASARSKVEINVYKQGLFKAFGHDHLIAAQEVSGSVQFDAQNIEGSSVRIKIDAHSLTVVDPGESEKDRRDVQATMTSEKVLDTAKFPSIEFSSTNLSSERKTANTWELMISGRLALHGVEKPVSLPVHLEVEENDLQAGGELRVLQTDFGIMPVSVGGGSVKVKDQLRITFTLVATKGNSKTDR